MNVEAATWTAEPSRCRVVGGRGLMHGLKGPNGHVVAGCVDLSVEVVRRPGAHTAVAGGAAMRRHVAVEGRVWSDVLRL